MPARTVLQPSLGAFGDDNGEGGTSGLWDPDANATTEWHDGAQGLGQKKWNLLVVNDQKVVNAMAAPGGRAHQCIHSIDRDVI
jgi:hypothetical protein